MTQVFIFPIDLILTVAMVTENGHQYRLNSLLTVPRRWSDAVSVSCFGVSVSVMFHFMFVHYTFTSVWVAEWPPFGK